eukprot:TRINITY_DN1102_c0_g3_i1.p1 TRINITY_DN1102_c0_g3~~TRINITY_DN1102_c0_g3_i1.p1  ORF type:complete len:151 (-),score=26.16 TRINITY_DN1102_c0_g3_i1:209-661(-)
MMKQKLKSSKKKLSNRQTPYNLNSIKRLTRKQKGKIMSGRKAIKEIVEMQAKTDNILPRASFIRLVREIANELVNGGMRWKETALEALQCAAEDHVSSIFEESQIYCIHAGRLTIQKEDMRLAKRYITSNQFPKLFINQNVEKIYPPLSE